MPKTKKATTQKPAKRHRKPTWKQEHLAVKQLVEEELQGLLQYLRSIHYIAIFLIVASVAALMYSLSVLFQNDHKAVIGFLLIILTAMIVSILSVWVLRPWVLPRFLLPLDMHQLSVEQLKQLFEDPDEYLYLLKTHTQILTEQFLVPKLKRLRLAISIFIFGMAVAIVLSIALP